MAIRKNAPMGFADVVLDDLVSLGSMPPRLGTRSPIPSSNSPNINHTAQADRLGSQS